jgi:hypothetical protein
VSVYPPFPSHGPRRTIRWGALLLAVAWLVSGVSVRAQSPAAAFDVQIGFKPLSQGPRTPTHKVGLWAPVFAEIPGDLNDRALELVVESEDTVDNATLSRFAAVSGGPNRIVARGFVKPGHVRNDMRVSFQEGSSKLAAATLEPRTSGLRDYLYLSLGAKLDDLAAALLLKEKARDDGKPAPRVTRFAVYETDVERLPRAWMGYDGVDLVILDTSDPLFAAPKDHAAIAPVWDWVRRGGRLVIAVDPKTHVKASVHAAKNLVPIEAWSGLHDKPFPPRGEPAIAVAKFDLADFAAGPWEILAQLDASAVGDRSLPLIARSPHGLGSVTVIAFPLASGSFSRWAGRVEFLRTLVDQLGPRFVPPEQAKIETWGREIDIADWGARLQRDLDTFDIAAMSFGSVALLMLLYTALVSAGDYFVLRRVIGRMDAAWITLPLIVIGVSVLAYGALNPGADPGMLVNQLDLIDIDGGSKQRSQSATSWFGVRSDAIHALDVAAALPENGAGSSALGWFGRPDDGPAGMGRAAGLALSHKSYAIDFAWPASRLAGVPFAYRGTRSFLVQSDVQMEGAPMIEATLSYHPREHAFKASGTLVNNLPFALENASLFLFDRVYPIAGGLKQGTTRIEIKATDNGMLPGEWRDKTDERAPSPHGVYDPGFALRSIMFHERLDPNLRIGNHLFRRLDWSWRLRDDPRVINVPLSTLGVREAILVGYGPTETAYDNLPARPQLTLRQGDRALGPAARGKLKRDTYVRAALALRPAP